MEIYKLAVKFQKMALIYYFLLISICTSLCGNTYAQWSRINPLPQENTINDLKFIQESGRIFGTSENSIIMYSDNDGNSWNLISNPANMPDEYLCNSVCFVSPDTGFLSGGHQSILKTYDGGLTWNLKFLRPEKLKTSIIHDIAFLNETLGFAVADSGFLLKTTDAGETWVNVSTDYYFNLYNIEVLNDSTAFICCEGNSLLKTTNSGDNWYVVDNFPGLPDGNISNLILCNNEIGFLLIEFDNGDYDIYRTIDGCESWNICSIDKIFNLFHGKFACYDADHITLTGPCYLYCNLAFITSDGGDTWSSSYTPIGWGSEAVCYTSEMDVLLGGPYGQIARTENGTTWVQEDSRIYSGTVTDLDIIDNTTGFALTTVYGGGVPESRLYKTHNLGVSWSELDLPNDYPHTHLIEFLDSLKGYVFGIYGEIRYTNDGAQSWQERTSTDEFEKVLFINELNGFGLTNMSVYKTSDGAQTWEDVGPAYFSFTDFELKSTDTVFLIGSNSGMSSILRSTNMGSHWEIISQISDYANDLVLTKGDTAYLMCNDIIYRSTDGCFHWTAIPLSIDVLHLAGIFFTNNNTGYLIGNRQNGIGKNNILLKTTDAGTTWGEIETNSTSQFTIIDFFDQQTGLITADYGLMLRTTTGGGNVSVPFVPYNKDTKFSIYPNPATGMITLSSEDNVNSTLRITDLTGRILQTGRINKKETKVDISALQPGVYLFSVAGAGCVKVMKQ